MDTGGVHGRGALILSKSTLCLRKSPFLEKRKWNKTLHEK